MSDEAEIAKRMAHLLRALARRLEENPDLLKNIGLNLNDIPTMTPKKKAQAPSINFDIFQIFTEGGEAALRQKLESLDIRSLKEIVRQHSFDPSKLADKWRKKERLLNLVIERVSARSDKGKVFKEYP